MGHWVGAEDRVVIVNIEVGFWEAKGSSSDVEYRSVDQTESHRVSLDKIQFGKVLGESPQIQIFNEIDHIS